MIFRLEQSSVDVALRMLVEDVDELFGAWRKVLGGESTGVLALPEEVQQSPGELLLHLPGPG